MVGGGPSSIHGPNQTEYGEMMAEYTLPELPYDYAALGREVDFMVITAYDQHHQGSSPGPIAARLLAHRRS